MAAGPYPTKVMHEALKTRVDTLENATPGAGDSGGPAYLSDRVLLDTTGTRAIDPAEIPDGLSIQSCILTLDLSAAPLTFATLEGGIKQGGASLSLYVAASLSDLESDRILFSGYTDDNYQIIFPEPVTVPPGGVISVGYGQPLNHSGYRFRADPVLPPGVTYSLNAEGTTGVPVAGPPFTLLTPGTVLGSLAPDAMNVKLAAGPLNPGEFEILDTGTATPTLRYCNVNGVVFVLEMTPEGGGA